MGETQSCLTRAQTPTSPEQVDDVCTLCSRTRTRECTCKSDFGALVRRQCSTLEFGMCDCIILEGAKCHEIFKNYNLGNYRFSYGVSIRRVSLSPAHARGEEAVCKPEGLLLSSHSAASPAPAPRLRDREQYMAVLSASCLRYFVMAARANKDTREMQKYDHRETHSLLFLPLGTTDNTGYYTKSKQMKTDGEKKAVN